MFVFVFGADVNYGTEEPEPSRNSYTDNFEHKHVWRDTNITKNVITTLRVILLQPSKDK